MSIRVGQAASLSKTISESDVYIFAGITGDFNEVHINEKVAGQSIFQGRIVHGLLSAGLISAVIGTRLPGSGSIYLSQNLVFTAPVKIGDTITATVTVKEILNAKKGIYRLDTSCTNQNCLPVMGGEAIVKYLP